MNIPQYLEKHRMSQEAFAKLVGVSQGLVWQWLKWLKNRKQGTQITAERAKQIEAKTNGEIQRAELRPDLWERAA